MRFLFLILFFTFSLFSCPVFACDTTGTTICQKYYPNGRIQSSESYRNGIRHGTWKYFEVDGKINRKVKYKNGKRIWESIYKDNKLIETIDKKGRRKIIKDCGCH